ncbi:MAG: HhH-GPD family protein [Acidimicrobiales bacterium]
MGLSAAPAARGRAPALPRARAAGLSAAVLAWGDANRRDLPWRRTRDPWLVLVSEVMLQQTQVSRVLGHYDRFTNRFPTAAACAAADVAEVVRAWAGLGYNRRAVSLHRAATAVVAGHGGQVPEDLDCLRALPGVGAYTARAVLVFAYEHPVGVVDTNVARLLARCVAGRRLPPAAAQSLADRLVPADRAWSYTQAMFDLGSLHCTAAPSCGRCPLRRRCAWARAGHPAPDPAVGSAGVGRRQSTFAGSERQGRGRLVAALRDGPLAAEGVAAAAGWPDEPARARRAAAGLVADGLAGWDGDHLRLA